jgi:hypothetical protein
LITSNTSKQPDEPIFFVDRTHGRKKLPNLLKKVGMKVEVHYKHFDPEAPDDEWIRKCAANGWIIVTGDKAIETDPINLKAVEESGAKVFITADTNSKAEEWAAAIIVGRRKLARIVEYNNGAFCVDVDKHATNHVSPERYKGSGGPKPREENVISQPPETISSAAVAEPEPLPDLQGVFQFPKDQPTADVSEDDIMIDIETREREGQMNKTSTATFDGVPFRVELEWGRQVACAPTCPNCGHELEQSAIAGQEAMLLCPSDNKGCTTPVKSFKTAEEMAQFLNRACAEIEKRMKP